MSWRLWTDILKIVHHKPSNLSSSTQSHYMRAICSLSHRARCENPSRAWNSNYLILWYVLCRYFNNNVHVNVRFLLYWNIDCLYCTGEGMRILVCHMTLSYWVCGSDHFEGTYCLHSQGSSDPSSWTNWPLRMEALHCFGSWASTHTVVQHRMTEDDSSVTVLRKSPDSQEREC